MQKKLSKKYVQSLNLEPSVPLHGTFASHVHLPQISPHRLLRGFRPRWSLLFGFSGGLLLPSSTLLYLHVTQG